MKKNLGLVMTGGGARAAYQVGVVRAIYEILKNDQHLIIILFIYLDSILTTV